MTQRTTNDKHKQTTTTTAKPFRLRYQSEPKPGTKLSKPKPDQTDTPKQAVGWLSEREVPNSQTERCTRFSAEYGNPNLHPQPNPASKDLKRYKVTLPKGANIHLRFGCYGW